MSTGPRAVVAAASYRFDVGDLVQWQDGNAYGRVVDRTADGTFDDEITTGSGEDADQEITGTEDEPAYLLSVYEEAGEDQDAFWVPQEADGEEIRVAHLEETLMSWDISDDKVAPADVEGAAPAATVRASTQLAAPSDVADGLEGVVWASGEHRLYVNGEPTRVYVPPETIPQTFDQVQAAIADGEVPIGFDHPEPGSVAAETPVGELGRATDVAMAADEDAIVLTDSEWTNDRALEAAEAGEFDDFEFSIVGSIPIEYEGGEPKTTASGALVTQAASIDRIDVVETGAVDGAQVGRVPELAAALAQRLPARSAAATVRAATSAPSDTSTDMNDITTDPESLEAAESALEQAADTIDEQDDRIESLEAEKAALEKDSEALAEIAAAHGLNPEDDEFEAQAVVDAHTEDLRREIAELEAKLPSHDVDEDGVDERVEQLAGSGVQALEALAGRRYRERAQAKQRRQARGGAVAASEQGSPVGAGAGGANEDAEDLADAVLTAREVQQAQAEGISAAEYLQREYDVDATQYGSEPELMAALGGGN
jgi:hypothetical protein